MTHAPRPDSDETPEAASTTPPEVTPEAPAEVTPTARRVSRGKLGCGLLCAALVALQVPALRRPLIASLASGGPTATRAFALQRVEGPGVGAVLVAALEDDSATIRVAAMRRLLALPEEQRPGASEADGALDEGVIRALLEAARDEREEVAKEASKTFQALGAPAAPGLAAQLSDPELVLRQTAVAQLINLGAEAAPAAPGLIKALQDDNAGVRALALAALAAAGEPAATLPAIEPLLDDPAPHVRSQAERTARALILRPGFLKTRPKLSTALAETAVEMLLPMFRESAADAEERAGLARALGALGAAARPAIGPLAQAAQSGPAGLRIAAAEALLELGRPVPPEHAPRVRAAAFALAGDSDERLRCAGLLLLSVADGQDRERGRRLRAGLSAKSVAVRRAASAATGRCGPEVLAEVLTLFGSPDADHREAAITAAALVGEPAFPILARRLEARSPTVRESASRALGLIGGAVTARLARLIREGSSEARKGALLAMILAGKESVPTLREELKGGPKAGLSTGPWRSLLLLALRGIGEDAAAAVPELIPLLDSSDGADAAGALGAIGPAAKAALPGLITLSASPDAARRQAAVEALGRIAPRDPDAQAALKARLADADPYVQELARAALDKASSESDKP